MVARCGMADVEDYPPEHHHLKAVFIELLQRCCDIEDTVDQNALLGEQKVAAMLKVRQHQNRNTVACRMLSKYYLVYQ